MIKGPKDARYCSLTSKLNQQKLSTETSHTITTKADSQLRCHTILYCFITQVSSPDMSPISALKMCDESCRPGHQHYQCGRSVTPADWQV